jgi:hypothetical protein
MSRSRQSTISVAACSLLALTAACGEANSHTLGGVVDHSTPPESLSVGLCRQGADLELIDDMEDSDGSILFSEGRSGEWYSYNDQSPGGAQDPPFPSRGFSMKEIQRAASRRAAQTFGHDFDNWGSGIGCKLRSGQVYDASSYAGITFWARRSVEAGTGAPDPTHEIRLGIPDRQTNPLVGECGDHQNCDNNFGAAVELSDDWQFHMFFWQELGQQWDSGVELSAIDVSALYQIQFQAGVRAQFDYWIDDLAFLCRH